MTRIHSRRSNLTFIDQAILEILARAPNDMPPTQHELYHPPDTDETTGLINEWLEKHEVPMPLVTFPVSGKGVVPASIKKLKRLGLLTQVQRGSYTISKDGAALLQALGDDWREWYVRLPISDGEFLFDRGQQVSRLLLALK